MSKFTPGPWTAHLSIWARGEKPEYQIHWSDAGECVAEVVHGEDDAYLIAAAPDLYAALEALILEDAGCKAFSGSRLSNARAALAKARGES